MFETDAEVVYTCLIAGSAAFFFIFKYISHSIWVVFFFFFLGNQALI